MTLLFGRAEKFAKNSRYVPPDGTVMYRDLANTSCRFRVRRWAFRGRRSRHIYRNIHVPQRREGPEVGEGWRWRLRRETRSKMGLELQISLFSFSLISPGRSESISPFLHRPSARFFSLTPAERAHGAQSRILRKIFTGRQIARFRLPSRI